MEILSVVLLSIHPLFCYSFIIHFSNLHLIVYTCILLCGIPVMTLKYSKRFCFFVFVMHLPWQFYANIGGAYI